MPEPIQLAVASGLAFASSALLLASLAFWGRRHGLVAPWIDLAWIVGISFGFYLGCGVLGVRPRWPPHEDLDRLMGIIIPASIGIEFLSAFPRIPTAAIWALRLAFASCVGRVLLSGSVYLSGPHEPGTLAWLPVTAALILGLIALTQAISWLLMDRLGRRASSVSTVVGLAIAIGGSAITIMLSGYASGGQVGLPLSAAFLGASSVAVLTRWPARLSAPIGLAIVGLSRLLIIGRFFGELRTDHAALLFLAPLLAWLPELPQLWRMPSWARRMTSVLLVCVLVVGVLADAGRRFAAGSAP